MFPLLLPLRLWPHLRRQRWRVVLAVLTVLPDPLLMVGIPVLLQLVIDRVLASTRSITSCNSTGIPTINKGSGSTVRTAKTTRQR